MGQLRTSVAQQTQLLLLWQQDLQYNTYLADALVETLVYTQHGLWRVHKHWERSSGEKGRLAVCGPWVIVPS